LAQVIYLAQVILAQVILAQVINAREESSDGLQNLEQANKTKAHSHGRMAAMVGSGCLC
jgi:hypothetical protein